MNPNQQQTAPPAPAPEAPPPPPPPAKTKAVSGQTEQVISLLDVIVDEQDRKAIVEQELTRLRFNQNYRLAEMFEKAGYFDSNGYNSPPMTAAQAMAKIAVGENWGLNPADSIRFIYIIGGKPAIEEAVFASRMQESGWNWDVQFIGGQGAGCKGVRLFAEKNGQPFMRPVRDDATGEIVRDEQGKPLMRQAFAEFTEEQAAQIKIWQNKTQVPLLQKSGPWSDGRRSNMYYWRALSQFRRWFCPQVMKGALIRDEIGDIADLEVAKTETPLPSERAAVFAEIERAKKEREAKAAPVETKQPESAKEAQPAIGTMGTTKQPAPITKPSFTALTKLEAELGTTQFMEILKQSTFDGLKDVKYEVDALAVIARMNEAKGGK